MPNSTFRIPTFDDLWWEGRTVHISVGGYHSVSGVITDVYHEHQSLCRWTIRNGDGNFVLCYPDRVGSVHIDAAELDD